MNLVSLVLALLCKDQRDMLIIHAKPPDFLHTTLELDHETYHYAQQLEENANRHGATATD